MAMEIVSAQPLASRFRLISGTGSCRSRPSFPLKVISSVCPRSSISSQCSSSQLRGGVADRAADIKAAGKFRIAASSEAAGAASTSFVERWLLQPIGDGDSRHIGFKVERPGAFEIASNEVTVGRLPEKADMVIPVATVSGVHARIEKKGDNLLITDLDSTNGTFINEKRLRPGVAAAASPGSRITFGDTHLAIFLLSRVQVVETSSSLDPQESTQESENQSSYD